MKSLRKGSGDDVPGEFPGSAALKSRAAAYAVWQQTPTAFAIQTSRFERAVLI